VASAERSGSDVGPKVLGEEGSFGAGALGSAHNYNSL